MPRPRRNVSIALIALVALSLLAACGDDGKAPTDSDATPPDATSTKTPATGSAGGDASGACAELLKTIREVGRKSGENPSDIEAQGRLFAEGASSVRAAAEESGDGDVEQAGAAYADALEALGEQVAAQPTQMPDTNAFEQASSELRRACS